MPLEDILALLIAAAGVGVLLYLFNLLPIDATIKKIAVALILVLAILWALRWIIWKLG